MAFSEGGKQKKAERRGQEDALDFESRDRHKNPRRRFTFSGLILEKKKKKTSGNRNKFSWFVPRGPNSSS